MTNERDDQVPEANADPATSIPQRVLVVQAHPDDVEFSCGATIAKWARGGAEIYYCSITSGDKGSKDPELFGEKLSATREAEQRAAAAVLGVRDIIFLNYRDAELEPTLELRRDITRVIRQIRPTAFLCQDPTQRFRDSSYINHPDHVAAGNAALAAVFPSCRDRHTFPELLAEGLEPINVPHVYVYGTNEPNCWVDISETFETKLEALRSHVSQVGTDFAARVRQWAEAAAASHPDAATNGITLAESFRYLHIG